MHNRVPSPPAGAVTFEVADADDVARDETGPVETTETAAETAPEAPTPAAAPAPTRPPRPRRPTLWEQGNHPGRLVVRASTILVLLWAAASVLLLGRIGPVFDVFFVGICAVAALWVRPRDFFMVGVFPPILMGSLVVALAFIDTGAVAQANDAVAQAVVSGLAHHAMALVGGYGLTLGLIAVRQLALRHRGRLRVRADR